MIKEKDYVRIIKATKEKDLKPLARTKWKTLVIDTYGELNTHYLYKVEKIKDEYAVISRNNDYFLIKLENIERTPYQIGCKVITIKSYQSCPAGKKGTVKKIDDSGNIGIEFEKREPFMHNLGGICLDGNGYWLSLDCIDVYDEYFEMKEKENATIKDLTEQISKLTEEIQQKERFQDIMNKAVIEKGKEIAIEDLKEKLKNELDDFIQQKYGVLPKETIEIKTSDYRKEIDGIFHKEFDNICKIVASNIPLMLVGSAGAGKNYTLEQVAKALNLDFYFSNAVNQEYKLTGFIDANGKYHETEFYKAFTKGGMFFLDEIDASCPECLVILNSAIANRYFDFPTGRVVAHKDFRVVCAGNTYGTGADMVYVGRNVLDGATLDRFVVLPFDYDDQVEKQLSYNEELYSFIKDLRKAINNAGLRYIVSMRAIINASKLLALGMPKKDILKTSIIKNMQIDDLNNIIKKLETSSEWTRELRNMCD